MTFKNVLLNGDFRFAQFGTIIPVPETAWTLWTLDSWGVWRGSPPASVEVRQKKFDLYQTQVPGFPRYYCQIDKWYIIEASSATNFKQRIEDVETLALGFNTLSFWARAYNEPLSVTVWLLRRPNPGNGIEDVHKQVITIYPDVWQPFVLDMWLPGFDSSWSVGEESYVELEFTFYASLHPTFKCDFALMDLRRGQVGKRKPKFEKKPLAVELHMIERTRQKSYNLETAPGTVEEAGKFIFTNPPSVSSTQQVFVPFRTRMKKTQYLTVKIYSPATGAEGFYRDEENNEDVAAIVTSVSETGFIISLSGSSEAGQTLSWHWTAEVQFPEGG